MRIVVRGVFVCKIKLNIKFITEVLKIWLLLSLSILTVLAQNTNTTSSYPFHVCHSIFGGNVNCTSGGVYSSSGLDVGYYNFSVVNTSAWNITLPEWTLSPTDDSYIVSYGYDVCNGICRNSSQWDSALLSSGVYARSYNAWSWLKFPRNESTTGINYCDNAYMCLYKYDDTGLTSTGYDFFIYYSYNQTWQEKNLTWDDHPDWVESYIDKQNITDTDDIWVCWDVSNAYCDNIESNATYMIRAIIEEFDIGSILANYSTILTRDWDLYVDENNKTYSFNSSEVDRMMNATNFEQRSYIRIAPNSVYFPGSIVNNATLMVYVPTHCNQTAWVNVYECREENFMQNMTWNDQPYCSIISQTPVDWTTTGWKTYNVTDEVQKSALSGEHLTSNISLMLGINSTFNKVSKSVTTFNDSSSSQTKDFTTAGNQTYWIKVPKYSNITSAYLNITGKQTWGSEWNYTATNRTSGNSPDYWWGRATFADTPGSCVIQSTLWYCNSPSKDITSASIDASFLFNVSSVSGASYNWTHVYANTSCTWYQMIDELLDVRVGKTSCSPANRCFLGSDTDDRNISCSDSFQLVVNNTDTTVNNIQEWTVSGKVLSDEQGEIIALICRGVKTGITAPVYTYQQWDFGASYINITIRNETYGYPNGTAIDIGGDGDWDWGKQNTNLTTTNRTDNIASEFNDYLSSCTADSEGYCHVPIVIHTDYAGTLYLDDVDVDYNMSACFAAEDYSGATYDPRIQIGFTYSTKNKIANFKSYNTITVSQRPYLIANITWDLNFSSQNGTSPVYTYEPNGQTDDQWIYKLCVDKDADGPMDIYLNLTGIVNSTDDSLTSLPSCVQSFYHYSNSTNVYQASAANITGNTAGRVLYNLQNGTCGYIWENITINQSACVPGDYFDFNFTWTGCTDSGGC